MADNLGYTPGTGATIRSKDKTALHAQVFILDIGGAGAELLLTVGQAAMASSIPVVISSDQSAVPVTVTKNAISAAVPTFATVGTSSAQALAANANRKGLVLVNTSANTISIGLGQTAVLNSGITLYPRDKFWMDEYSLSTGAVNAIASASSSNLSIQEFS